MFGMHFHHNWEHVHFHQQQELQPFLLLAFPVLPCLTTTKSKNTTIINRKQQQAKRATNYKLQFHNITLSRVLGRNRCIRERVVLGLQGCQLLLYLRKPRNVGPIEP